ncbi:5-oxoprolinase subunit PxpA [Nocardia sp. NBC_00508]|nr:5-oxoprolinase subunit PxpA [Nocardia sp. NBC_00508]
MGEGFGIYRLANDERLMESITMANVACGFHASDPAIMRRTVSLAAEHGVRVGAHPGFPDMQGFGRRVIPMEDEELFAAIVYQVGALQAFLNIDGLPLSYVKVHGALYGLAARDERVAAVIGRAADAFDVPLMGMAATMHEAVWGGRAQGFLAEYYVDLDYDDDGSLIITREHVAYEPERAAQAAVRAITEHTAIARSGKEIPMRADCVCVHSDTPNAAEIATAVYAALQPYLSKGIG